MKLTISKKDISVYMNDGQEIVTALWRFNSLPHPVWLEIFKSIIKAMNITNYKYNIRQSGIYIRFANLDVLSNKGKQVHNVLTNKAKETDTLFLAQQSAIAAKEAATLSEKNRRLAKLTTILNNLGIV